jgi:hypothetical protein
MRQLLMVDMNCTLQFMKSIESQVESYPWYLRNEHVRTSELVALQAVYTMDV